MPRQTWLPFAQIPRRLLDKRLATAAITKVWTSCRIGLAYLRARSDGRMDLYEHQAKELFDRYGVPTLRGTVVTTPEEAAAAAESMDLPVVVKAQVKVGGRGKAGGVKLARTKEDVVAHTEAILGMDIKGHTVHKVLIDPGVDIAEEYYMSFLVDRSNRSYLAMCSVAGGMDIETVAQEQPEALAKIPIDPEEGVDLARAREIAEQGHLPADILDAAAMTIEKLYSVFEDADASLVEVNPMVRTGDGRVLAIDGKVTLDDNSEGRHQDLFSEYRDNSTADPRELAAKEVGLNYVKLDGTVGIIGNGAGLVMSTLDVVAYAGEAYDNVRPANFLDIGGGASAAVMEAGLRIIMEDPQVEAVFVNVFGGITSCIEVANGILQALDQLGDSLTKPLVVRLDGNEVAPAREILDNAQHPLITTAGDMDEGAAIVARITASRLGQSDAEK